MKLENNLEQQIKLINLPKKSLKPRRKGLKLLAGFILMSLILFGFYIYYIAAKLPDISKLNGYIPNESSLIYDSHNRVIGKIFEEENRMVIPLKKIPLNVRNAVIAMEDERFFQHKWIDPKGTFRALLSIIDPTDKMVKGWGSTITQQLARNIFLTREKTFRRKISESILAAEIDHKYSKSEILELYLNEVYWGHNSYGIESAAKMYFGKPAKDMNLAEASLIGGILSAPEVYSPYRNMEKAKWRQSLTLQNMLKNGYITEAEAEKAKAGPIKLVGLKKNYKMVNPYFTSYVLAVLYEKYDHRLLTKGGLKIYTTMDTPAHDYAEKLIAKSVSRLKRQNITQGALVSIDPATGFIKAMVGGIDYKKS